MADTHHPQGKRENDENVASETQDPTQESKGEQATVDAKGREDQTEDNDKNEVPGFDDKATYCPVFCMIPVPDEVKSAIPV